jgi:hypothetical protein
MICVYIVKLSVCVVADGRVVCVGRQKMAEDQVMSVGKELLGVVASARLAAWLQQTLSRTCVHALQHGVSV